MSGYETLPVKMFRVVNKNTGKEREFAFFDDADQFLNDARDERPEAEWEMIAVVDA